MEGVIWQNYSGSHLIDSYYDYSSSQLMIETTVVVIDWLYYDYYS